MVFLVVLLWGQPTLLGTDVVGDFYDIQAHALLDGHLDVAPDSVGFEGFRMDDGTYIYQGLVPALARIPVIAMVGHRLDARMTRSSMLLAFTIAVAYVVATVWVLRRALRGTAAVSGAEQWAIGLFTFCAGTSSLLFLAGKSWVYHEAILWGATFALASFHHLLRWGAGARTGSVNLLHPLAAAVAAGLALNTRASVGMGPVVAVSLAAGAAGLAALSATRSGRWQTRMDRWFGGSDPSWRTASAMLAVLIVGVGAYVLVNFARFGSLFGVPLDRQVLVATDIDRQAALAANGNSLFGLRFIPSVLWQSIRPDAFAFRSGFPWIGFPGSRPAVIGSAVFAERDWSSSLTVLEPALVVLAIVGVVAVVRARPRIDGKPGPAAVVRIPMAGAAAGAAVYVAFAYVANRYLSDMWPFLVISAAVGLHRIALAVPDRNSDRMRIVLPVFLGFAAVWGLWVNSATALQYRFEVAPGLSAERRTAWLERQTGGTAPPDVVRVRRGEPLPTATRVGTVAVIGRCDAVYRSNGRTWFRLHSGSAGGGFDITLDVIDPPQQPVLLLRTTMDSNSGDVRLILEPDAGRFRLVTETRSSAEAEPMRSIVGKTFDLKDGSRMRLRGAIDAHRREVDVRDINGNPLLDSPISVAGGSGMIPVGSGEVSVRSREPDPDWCQRHGLSGD